MARKNMQLQAFSQEQLPDQESCLDQDITVRFKISKSRNFSTTKPPAVKRAQKIDAMYWFSENSVDETISISEWF